LSLLGVFNLQEQTSKTKENGVKIKMLPTPFGAGILV
jgi:hypothetical protein